MAEGPQVLRRTEWLNRYLSGRKILRCISQREDLPAKELASQVVKGVFCKGKNIFIEFEERHFLHNHLLMRGKWKKLNGAQLFVPAGTWLALDVGSYTICNIGGQRLRLINQQEVDRQLTMLGPDVLADPYPKSLILKNLLASQLPISEALLQQSILAGVGNIAKSEILFTARLAPQRVMKEFSEKDTDRLMDAIHSVLWTSYHQGGRWDCRVYRRGGKPCVRCGASVISIALRPSKRATYYCPRCQSGRD